MAKPGAAGSTGSPGIADGGKEGAEMRIRLKWLASAIAGGCGGVLYEEATRILEALRELETGKSVDSNRSSSLDSPVVNGKLAVPEYFLCPISKEIMTDPVVITSGQTYDRPFIRGWLDSGNRTCPQTQQVLSNTMLIPNHLVRNMISEWCIEHRINLPSRENQDEDLVTNNERISFGELLNKVLSPSSCSEQKQAIKDLRLLTKHNRSFRAVIGENPDAITQMLSVLSIAALQDSPDVLEDAVTTILNLSIHDSNKQIIGDDPEAIPFLIQALESGTMETRCNSAAAIFSLSALDSNKSKIGQLGAMKPLVDLLENGSATAKKDSASAIFNLCMLHENKLRAVRAAAIDVMLRDITDKSLVDESLAILTLLSSDQEALEEICETGGVPLMLGILKDNPCKRNRENAVVVLFSICMYDRTKLKQVAEDEDINQSLALLADNGTPRARRKASGILDKLKKTMHNIHNSC